MGTQTAKLKGDYRSGKRLSMKKVIAYIASDFRRDKIWLRRTKPSKRTYQVMLSIDNSQSMAHNCLKQMTLETIAILSGSLSLLDVGNLGVCTFGEDTNVLHPIELPWTSKDQKYDLSAGARIMAGLNFDQTKTNTNKFLRTMTEYLSTNPGSGNNPQLSLIVSDAKGLFVEGRDLVKQAMQESQNRGIFTILIILDSDVGSKTSVLNTKTPVFLKNGAIQMRLFRGFSIPVLFGCKRIERTSRRIDSGFKKLVRL